MKSRTAANSTIRHVPHDSVPVSRSGLGSRLLVVLISALVVLPIGALIWQASGDSSGVWPHLIAHVLPHSATTTVVLLAGVGIGTLVLGSTTAWLISRYRFPFRGVLQWALVLPLAIPTYIAAYTWVEFADFTGPLQTFVRNTGGFASARDYWFPDIRSTGGAVFLITLVLFPYVYLPARLSFNMQSQSMLDVARVLGSGPWRLFIRVGLQSARPALAVGVILALMETLNDIGAVEYLGVRTLTYSVFDTWLNRSSLAGAAQLSLALLAIILVLVAVEKHFRAKRSYSTKTHSHHGQDLISLSGTRAILAFGWCLLPVVLGFVIPVLQLAKFTITHREQVFDTAMYTAAANSLEVAVGAAMICVIAGFTLVYAARRSGEMFFRITSLVSGVGYAVPGTILAIGILTALAGFDNFLSDLMESWVGTKTGLLLSGTLAIVIYACCVRFMAIAIGNIEAGYSRISGNMIAAARTLGRSERRALIDVELPLLARTLGIAGLLVLVDSMKELSATLLLRPFNFNTLATYVYERATRAVFEEAAFAALAIVAIGLVPVYVLTRVIISEHSPKPQKKMADLAGPPK
jgi:iron(III) transport system permease protein